MFDDILIASLISMDDNQLQITLESMSYDELSYVDAVMEAKYTEQDLADFQDMMRIQNAAHRDGWKNVSKNDYERIVNEKQCNLTPVPNGVGQMTVIELIEQTIEIAEKK